MPGQPADDVANYLQPLVKLLQKQGYSAEEATAAARVCFRISCRMTELKPGVVSHGRILTMTSLTCAWPS